MTELQKFRFYFPAWNACCAANNWRTQKGQLVIDLDRLTEEGRMVHVMARQRAQAEGRPVKVDDMRRGAHIVALERDKSSEKLTNPEVDRVVTLFNLLKDPDDLEARMKWDAYQRGEDPGAKKRVDWFIKNAAPDAYVRHISADKFGTRQWESLNDFQKQQLARTLSERRRAKQQPIQPVRPVQQELVGSAPVPASRPNPRNYQLNPHKVYVKGPF